MIRIIYWLLALIEILLILAVLLLFIVTDSRTIKYIADKSLINTSFTYESVQGNLFSGLEVQKLAYDNKELFSSARIHWNPLTLFYDKVTITKLEIHDLELQNIIAMSKALKSKESNNTLVLDFSLVVNSTHLDINPYVFEGVKFSSFVFETKKIEIKKDLKLNADWLYLKFDSDLANVGLHGKIVQSRLLIDNLDLEDISVQEITKLTRKLKAKKSSRSKKSKNNSKIAFVEDIKIKHISGSMKAINYGDFKIKGAKLHAYNGTIDVANNFNYQVKKITFTGQTNFGTLDYNGHIKDSNIYAKGFIELDEHLFKRYALPLNFQGLKKLPSTLHLNHKAVWIEIDHEIQNLLNIKNDFNINVFNAKHQLHYDYAEALLKIDSAIHGDMTYANNFNLHNSIRINKGAFTYGGDISVSQVKALPYVVSDYLLPSFSGTFKGTSHDFEMDIDSELLRGYLSLPKYKSANLSLDSKFRNIELSRLGVDLPLALQDEPVSFTSQSHFDFQDLESSQIKLTTNSNTLSLESNMLLQKPYEIHFNSTINDDTRLREMIPKLNFQAFKNLSGFVRLEPNHYVINAKNEEVELSLNYNALSANIESAFVRLNGQTLNLQSDSSKNLIFETKIPNIQAFFEDIQEFYQLDIPNVQGEVNLRLEKTEDDTFHISFKSPKLQYLVENGVDLSITNFYDIETTFSIDKDQNIDIENYSFRLDDNGYLSNFYSNRHSILSLNNNNLNIEKLWINDKIEVQGNYNISTLSGILKVDSKSYEVSSKDYMLVLDLNLNVELNKEKISIKGDIDILGDRITYEMAGNNIVEDSDIIIVKDALRNQESALDNIKLYLKIKNKKPLKYIANDVNIEFLNELSLLKNYKQDMLLTGVTTITKGFYQFEEKEFTLDESHLYFTGDIKSPLLDIKANYEKDEYNVHIFISGTTESPIVNFNSEPYLTQQEILSLILFDGTGSSSGNGAEAYTLLGGTFAKGLIKSLGIDVDHFLLGQDSQQELSLEIGKRVSRNISVLYLHKDGLDGVKVRVEHSKSFETDIIIQPPNTSSIEFLYKLDR